MAAVLTNGQTGLDGGFLGHLVCRDGRLGGLVEVVAGWKKVRENLMWVGRRGGNFGWWVVGHVHRVSLPEMTSTDHLKPVSAKRFNAIRLHCQTPASRPRGPSVAQGSRLSAQGYLLLCSLRVASCNMESTRDFTSALGKNMLHRFIMSPILRSCWGTSPTSLLQYLQNCSD